MVYSPTHVCIARLASLERVVHLEVLGFTTGDLTASTVDSREAFLGTRNSEVVEARICYPLVI